VFLSITVRRESVLLSIGKAFGAQDVLVGYAPFDRRFIVKASDEDLARAWLVPVVTHALVEALPYIHELGEGGEVLSTRIGIESDVNALLRAVNASVSLARRGAAIRAEWRRLAHELQGIVAAEPWANPEPRLEIQEQGTTVLIELTRIESLPKPLRGRLLTCLRASRPVGGCGDHFVGAPEGTLHERDGDIVELEPGKAGGFEVRSKVVRTTATRFDDELLDAIADARPMRLWGDDDTLVVVFLGIMLDVVRLRSAVKIVAHLAASVATGPYR
jgi:hypothetical protein